MAKSGTASKEGPIDSILIALAGFFEQMGQFNLATSVYNFALTCNPNCASATANRALIFMCDEDDEHAIKDLNKACAKAPRSKVALRTRGLANLVRGNFEGATKDFKKALESDEWDSLTVLLAYPAIAKTNGVSEAAQLLSDAIESKLKGQDWPYPIVQCLRGDISMTDLLPQASTPAKLMESRAFIGFIKAFSENPQDGKADIMYVYNAGSGSPMVRLMAARGLKVIEEGLASDVAAKYQKADRISGVDFMG